ncbi:IDEAL domain-containing protein [Bacillus carboniphilus]|uniref:IDEAL domain-containing protein n=1 Tax=Bacillus carboniphilus TaxID=86663 RepID=A0ABY9JWI4_9BACI|nr:IDEAL domain-containing protein [Bacillus carboniphilus]WLR42868.1 IDEAL domain-containing protein [Bacillus carboniphilus]
MKEKKSYTELMKTYQSKENGAIDKVLDMYIEMLWDEALYKHHKLALEKKIDCALDSRDHQEFLVLSKQYKELTAYNF